MLRSRLVTGGIVGPRPLALLAISALIAAPAGCSVNIESSPVVAGDTGGPGGDSTGGGPGTADGTVGLDGAGGDDGGSSGTDAGPVGADPDGSDPVDPDGGGCTPLTCAGEGFNCGPLDDGCGNTVSCGLCDDPNSCGGGGVDGQCGCTAACLDAECGGDGCGGSCGTCPGAAPYCVEGKCLVEDCDPSCAGKVCGSNGCGGSCGSCSPGDACDAAGQCVVDWPGEEVCSAGARCYFGFDGGESGCLGLSADEQADCTTTCREQVSQGQPLESLDEAISCAESNDCLAGGGVPGSGWTNSACASTNCAEELITCVSGAGGDDDSCTSLWSCTDGCEGEDACIDACLESATTKAGIQLLQLLGCAQLQCPPESQCYQDAVAIGTGCEGAYDACHGDACAQCDNDEVCIAGTCEPGAKSTCATALSCALSLSDVSESCFSKPAADLLSCATTCGSALDAEQQAMMVAVLTCAQAHDCQGSVGGGLACVLDHCPVEIGQCFADQPAGDAGDTSCGEILECTAGCSPGDPCSTDCVSTADQSGWTEYYAVLGCLVSKCANAGNPESCIALGLATQNACGDAFQVCYSDQDPCACEPGNECGLSPCGTPCGVCAPSQTCSPASKCDGPLPQTCFGALGCVTGAESEIGCLDYDDPETGDQCAEACGAALGGDAAEAFSWTTDCMAGCKEKWQGTGGANNQYFGCLFSECSLPVSECATGGQSGTKDCPEMMQCLQTCGDGDQCPTACYQDASPQALHNYFDALGCAFSMCPADGDDGCIGAALLDGACGESAAACFGGGPVAGGQSCSDVSACLDTAGKEGNPCAVMSDAKQGACVEGCLSAPMATGQTSLVDDLVGCYYDKGCLDGDTAEDLFDAKACQFTQCAAQFGACAVNGQFGGLGCGDILNCQQGCPGLDPECPTSCLVGADPFALESWYLAQGCLFENCDVNDVACITDSTQPGGLCWWALELCVSPP